MSKEKNQTKGLWAHRFTIQFFTVVLAVLFYWLLGFVIDDIRSIPEPKYEDVELKFLNPVLLKDHKDTAKQIEEKNTSIEELKSKQEILGDSTTNLQKTMNQLLDLQKLSLQKGVARSESERKNLTQSLSLFLSNQKRYQEMSQNIALLMDQKRVLEAEQKDIEEKLENQKKPAHEEHEKLLKSHRHKLAFFELLFLIPLLGIAGSFIVKRQESLYLPLFLAFGAAALLEVALVIHEYFPSRYFKYILTLSLIAAVIRLLLYIIRMIAFPKVQWLIKQYREAYERFFCPVCEFPIRRGPLKFSFWDRRSIKKLSISTADRTDDQNYVCPACGTALYEECSSCKKIRHSLLPNCEHCGNKKEITSTTTS